MYVMVFPFCFQVFMWLPCSQVGPQLLGLTSPQPFKMYPWQAYGPPGDGPWPTSGVHHVAAPPTSSRRRELCAPHSAVPQPFHQCGQAHSLRGLAESHPIPLPYLHGQEWSSYPGCVPPDDLIHSKSVVGITFGVPDVIGYQVDKFNCT